VVSESVFGVVLELESAAAVVVSVVFEVVDNDDAPLLMADCNMSDSVDRSVMPLLKHCVPVES
jgi:hypothetical protein